jgi:hypothetical protein
LASKVNGLVLRIGALAGLLLAAAPLLAQDNAAATAPPPAPAENIGPRELSNFSLEGTVTRPAARPPAVQAPAPTAREPAAREPNPAPAASDRPRMPTAEPRTAQPERRPAIDPISSRPSPSRPASTSAPRTAAPGFSKTAPVVLPDAVPEGFSLLPWLAALLLLGAGAVIYFGLQKRNRRYAIAGASEFVAPTAEPRPAPAPPAVRPAPRPVVGRPPVEPPGTVKSNLRAPAPPAGVVSASLRPWIELELEPSQAMVTDEHAAIAFDVTLFNSGSAPARDVAVEACLINAGQQQDVQLSQFYTTPGEVRDKIPAVAPLSRITLKSAVRLPREAVQEYEVEGRKLFMPMVAVNSRYRWSSGEGQSAASFLVGRGAEGGDRLGPLRLDQGARGWKGLAARRYEKGIRV